MNIAFVNSTKIWSGVKTWMMEFGKELQKKGHNIYFFARDPIFVEETRKCGSVSFLLKFGPDYNPVKIRYFLKKFRELKIDITCMNIQKELRTAGIAAKMLNIPVVHRVGLPGDINRKFDQRLAQKLIVDEILVTSSWIKEELASKFSFIPEEKICLIHNAKPVNGRVRESVERPVRFVITSRLAEGKGHLTLIKAFQALDQRGLRDFTCDIYGNGPMKNEIRESIRLAGLESKLILKGFKRNIRAQLDQYSFGLLASKVEGFPNTVAEYMSAALPCIVTDGGGTSELIVPGINGFIYQYQEVQRLTKLLTDCLEMDSRCYANMSKQAIQTMQNSFELRSNVQRLSNRFCELILNKDQKSQVNSGEIEPFSSLEFIGK